MAACNITALYQYGAHDSLLHKAWKEGRKAIPIGDEEMDDALAPAANEQQPAQPPYGPSQAGNPGGCESPPTQSIQEISFSVSKRLAFTILSLTLDRIDDNNVRPHWHAWMVFLSHIIGSVPAARLIETDFPWEALVKMLNKMLVQQGGDDADISDNMDARFPSPVGHPLPEDYNLRGFDWARSYFPPNWFEDARIDGEERTQEFPSMTNIRRERILWLAARICANGDWLAYSADTRSFAKHPALRQRLEDQESDEGDWVYVADEVVGWECQPKVLQQAFDPVATPETIAGVALSVLSAGPEALHPEYTAYVVDTNLLIARLEAFSLITGTKWSVVPMSGNITPSAREIRRSNLIYC